MAQPNLTLTFKFKNDTPEAILEIYDEEFDFEYGLRERQEKLENLETIINIHGETGIATAQSFLFSNYSSIINNNNLQEIKIEIFRPNHTECNKTFTFPGNSINNFSFIYMNNNQGNSQFVLSFNFFPFE